MQLPWPLRDFVTTEMLEVAATFLQSQTSTVSPLGTLGAVSRGQLVNEISVPLNPCGLT